MNAAHDESGMIEKFLGPDRASGSPFDLLGVPPKDLAPAEVVGALEGRLAEIDRHPECRTPSADEVRLALHATAAQLMDPVVRGVLIRQWGQSSRGTWDTPAAPPVTAPVASARLALESDAVLAIAMEGGWNDRSLQRLCMFAHARGLTAVDVANAIQRLARPDGDLPRVAAPRPMPQARPMPAPAPMPSPMAPVSTPHAAPPNSSLGPSPNFPQGPQPGPQAAPAAGSFGPGFKRAAPGEPAPLTRPRTFELTEEEVRRQTTARLRVVAGVVGCGTILLFSVATGVFLALRGSPTPTPPPPIPKDQSKATPAKPDPARPAPPKRPSDVSTDVTAADAVRRQVAAATDRLKEDAADAARQFGVAMVNASSSWVRWTADELAAVQDAVIEYLYHAEREADVLRAAAESMGSPARAAVAGGGEVPDGRVLPALWSAGILSRVVRERDLPASVAGPSRLSLAALLGSDADLGDGTFTAGVARGVVALTPRLASSPEPEAWRRWLEALATTTSDPPSRGRLVAAALDATLLANPEPLGNPKAMESISVLATALSWRAEEQTRGWIFRWFDSSAVTTPALHALTAAVAARSSAEGITPAMVLSAAASGGERSELRAKYAAAWTDAPGGVRSELLTKWEEAADQVLSSSAVDATVDGIVSPAGSSELRPHVLALVRAVTLSRLSEAGAWLSVGDTGRAGAVVGDLNGPMRAKTFNSTTRTDPLGGDNDGAWAVRYLAPSTNATVRAEMLKQAVAADALTALECEVVASEAVRGLPMSVREAARKAVSKHRALPAMLNAMLNMVPLLPAATESAVLVEELTGGKLPPLRDARWREAVRRSLVERLLELAAGKGEYGAIDTLATLLGASLRERVAALGGADGIPPEIDGATLLRLAETYHARWDKEAERIPPTGKEPSTLGQIRQRGAGRAGVAANVVQRFVAEQSTTVELMAHVMVAEDAARAERVSAIIAEWDQSRRAAVHVFDQVLASEKAMLALWRVRIKGAST